MTSKKNERFSQILYTNFSNEGVYFSMTSTVKSYNKIFLPVLDNY